MRSRSNLPVFIGYAVISLLVLGYLATQMGGEFVLQSPYRVKAQFASGAQLVPGDDVTVNGLRVGKIESLGPEAGGAAATLIIHQQYAPVYRDSRAMVKFKNLLGETYVELTRGTAASGPMPDGGVIDINHTLTPVELDQVLNALNQDTRSQLVLLINNLGQAVAGRGADLNASAGDLKQVASSLSTIAHTLATSSTQLDSLISSLRKVLETLAAWHSQFRSLITDWDRLMKVLASRESDLQGLFVNQDRVLGIFDQALSGQGAGSLHSALAGAPATLDAANHYLDDANIIYPQVTAETPSVAALFYELASVMSGTTSTDTGGGQTHAWRVYVTGAQK